MNRFTLGNIGRNIMTHSAVAAVVTNYWLISLITDMRNVATSSDAEGASLVANEQIYQTLSFMSLFFFILAIIGGAMWVMASRTRTLTPDNK